LGEKKELVCKVLFKDIHAYDPLIILRYHIDGCIVTVYAVYVYLFIDNFRYYTS